jgi:hypothetical protein
LFGLAQPKITSFAPTSGGAGISVTITGGNFSATPANNIVRFGATRATVTAASTTSLTVTVPTGTTFQPINVTTNNLTAYSSKPFVVTFNGAPQFTSQSFQYSTHIDSVDAGIETTHYAIGDFNDDGKLDIVTIDRLNNTMSVYRNTSAGNIISFASKINFTTGTSPRSVSAGDIDGDGKQDIVVSNLGDNTVSVFRNNSSGGTISFAPKLDFTTATQPSGISITDLDLDGKPDLAVNTVNLQGYVSVLRNTSTGSGISFAPKLDLASGGSIDRIETADIDGDGKPDIVVPNYSLNVISIFRNTSTTASISFVAPVTIPSFTNPEDLAVVDLNNDGKPDITITHFSNIMMPVLRNVSTIGNIVFQYMNAYSTGGAQTGLAVNDLDGDGQPDIVADSKLDAAYLFKNNSAVAPPITFNNGVSFPAGGTSGVQTGDFDNDGLPDLAFNSGMFRVTIWQNRTAGLQLISFLPASAAAGDTVTINGSNFKNITSVSFGGVPALSYTVVNPNIIMAVAGGGATGGISVYSSNDSAVIHGFLYLGPPVISSFNPASAGTAEEVTIKGQNLTGSTSLTIGGIPATYEVLDPFTIKAHVGNGASGNIVVTNPFGTGSKTGFTYLPKPYIISFSPANAVEGTVVTITGVNFLGVTAVSLGGSPAQSFTVIDSATIQAIVGQSMSGAVSVTNAFGSGSKDGMLFYPAPVITSFSPLAAAQGETVTITGRHFLDTYGVVGVVKFGGANAFSFSIVDSFTIRAVVNFGASGDITVESNRGNSRLPGFTFISPPFINDVSPTDIAPGSEVIITGGNFLGTTAVQFGDSLVSSFRVVSPDTIIAIAGMGMTGVVTVKTSHHKTSGSWVVFTKAPVIYQVNPTSGAVGSTVTIKGNNFATGAANNFVYFGSVKAEVQTASSGEIKVTVPAGAGYQPIAVTVAPSGLTGYSGQRFAVRFPVDPNAFNDSSFAGAMDLATGEAPYFHKQADFDGDGRLDIVVQHLSSNFISVYRNQSSPGQLNFSQRIDIDLGFPGKAMAIADVDGDGKLDIIASGGEVNPRIVILRNQSAQGMISFTPVYTIGGNAGFIETGDFNLDGRTDIVFICTNCGVVNGGIFISLNTGTGGTISFSDPILYSYQIASSVGLGAGIAVTDFDHNGMPDIVVGLNFSSGLFLFKNTRNNLGTFPSFEVSKLGNSYSSDGYYSLTPQTAPLSSEKYPNLLFDRYIYNNQGGKFSAGTQTSAAMAVVFDLNGDGRPDIVGTDKLTNNLSLIKNISDSASVQFAEAYKMSFGNGGGLITVADLDGDSKPEICISYRAQNVLRILRNRMNEPKPPAPVVSAFTPNRTGRSFEVLITGKNFNQTTRVTFGGVPAFNFQVVSPDSIRATVGNGAAGAVSVTTPGGTDSLEGFSFIPTPTIISASPLNVVPGDTVQITGTHLDSATQVSFGGVKAASFTVNSSTSITAVMSYGAAGNIEVVTPGGKAVLNSITLISPPALFSFEPQQALARQKIVISGYSFTYATEVSFGGVPALSFEIVSDYQINAIVGNGASGAIRVTTRAGTVTKDGFVLILPPVISAFTPTASATGAKVEISGIHFTGATEVSFGSVPVSSFTVNSSTSITAYPGNGASGDVIVTNPAGSDTLTGFTFLPPPTITNYSYKPEGAGATVTISGTNFSDVTAVSFGGAPPISYTVNSATSITAIVSPGTSGSIVVTTLGGTATMAGFNYSPMGSRELWAGPNPAHDNLTIWHPVATTSSVIRILDLYGAEIKTIVPTPGLTQTKTRVNGIAPGVYIIVWTSGSKTISLKFAVR